MSSPELVLNNRRTCDKSIEITLPYEEGQFRPSIPSGYRKYSNKFLRAVLDSMHLKDEGEPAEMMCPPFSPAANISHEDKPALPYEEGTFSPANPDGNRKYTNEFLKALGRLVRSELAQLHQRIELYSLDKLPYETGQYRPTYPEGDKKYSVKFLKAIGEMMMPDEDISEIGPLLSERSTFPWEHANKKPAKSRNTSKQSDDFWL